jgi:hypothetical protein
MTSQPDASAFALRPDQGSVPAVGLIQVTQWVRQVGATEPSRPSSHRTARTTNGSVRQATSGDPHGAALRR